MKDIAEVMDEILDVEHYDLRQRGNRVRVWDPGFSETGESFAERIVHAIRDYGGHEWRIRIQDYDGSHLAQVQTRPDNLLTMFNMLENIIPDIGVLYVLENAEMLSYDVGLAIKDGTIATNLYIFNDGQFHPQLVVIPDIEIDEDTI